ncbi:ComF family protein [Carnimonas bestiolae]|uniref:ComF family protein n=1 Tax=Carnimonas bestiolae TaxID=3402172 RepID=UPI003EDC1F60
MELFGWHERLLLRWLPGFCPLCRGRAMVGLPWCERCFRALPRNDHACWLCAVPMAEHAAAVGQRECERCQVAPGLLHQCWVPLVLQHEVEWLVRRYKSSGNLHAGRLLLELALSVLSAASPSERLESLWQCEAIVAVPPDVIRQRQRGFDHVQWLAKRLAKALGKPLLAAKRRYSVGSQRGLRREERWRNISDLFAISGPLPARVLLFDDVMTTGATLEVLARACFEAGAEWVGGLALARTPAAKHA